MDWFAVRHAILAAEGEIDGGGGQWDDQDRLRSILDEAMPALGGLEKGLADPATHTDANTEQRVEAVDAVAALAQAANGSYVVRLLGDKASVVGAWLGQVAPAIRALTKDKQAAVRAAALRCLVEMKDGEGPALLIAGLDDASLDVQDVALEWAAARGERAAAPRLLRRLADDLAAEAIEEVTFADPSPEARDRPPAIVVDQVRAIGIPEARPLLLARMVASTAPTFSCSSAAHALVELVDDSCVSALGAALTAGDLGSAYAAVALARRPAPGATRELLACLVQKPSPEHPGYSSLMHDAALHALALVGDPARVAQLLPWFEPPWSPIRLAALALVDHARAGELARAAIEKGAWAARIAALVLAVRTESAVSSVPVLQSLLTDSDPNLVYNAALALATLDADGLDPRAHVALDRAQHIFVDDLGGETFAFAVVVEALAQRLARLSQPLSTSARHVLACLKSLLAQFLIVVERGVDMYRKHAGGLDNVFVFAVSDRVDRAYQALANVG
jgi:hypothetical protein